MVHDLFGWVLAVALLGLGMVVSGCGGNQQKIAAREAALAKLQSPWQLKYIVPGGSDYRDTVLSASDQAVLLAAMRDSRPIDWNLKSKVEYSINGGQAVQVNVMEQNVFKIWESGDTEPGYYQSKHDLLGLLQRIARQATEPTATPHP